MYTDQDSLTVKHVELESAPEGQVNQSKLCDIMKDALNQLTDRLDAKVTQVTKESEIKIMENLDHSMAPIQGLLRRANRSMMISVLSDEYVQDAFEMAFVKVATSGPMVLAIS